MTIFLVLILKTLNPTADPYRGSNPEHHGNSLEDGTGAGPIVRQDAVNGN